MLSFAETPFSLQLSFEEPIMSLEKIAQGPAGAAASEAKDLLEEITAIPELRNGITNAVLIEQHTDLLKRLLKDYFPPALTLNEIKAISIPYTGITFNHTERFKNLLKDAGQGFDINIRDFDEHQFYVLSCCIILNEFYGTNLDFGKPLFYDIPTADGIVKHYRILYNADFLDILPTERSLPVTAEDIDLLINSYDNLALWKEKFPPDSWLLKGFAIMTLYDATVENAVSIFKEQLLTLNETSLQESMRIIFRSIYRIPDIQAGFTFYQAEDGTFSSEAFGQQMHSYLLNGSDSFRADELLCTPSYHCLIKKQTYFAISDIETFAKASPENKVAGGFLKQNVQSAILAPVVKHGRFYGVLEVTSPRKKELNSINANKLQVVMPFLTDNIERLVAEQQNQVQALIQERFTSIHRSVYWKFRHEAQEIIRHRYAGETYGPAEIVFPDVYPLYGQVDIKGSSEARNSSLQQDLKLQLQTLIKLLSHLNEQKTDHTFNKELHHLHNYLIELSIQLRADTEQHIVTYLAGKVYPRLNNITDQAQQTAIREYFAHTTKENGDFHIHRRRYENTIGIINNKMAEVIDNSQVKAQAHFPHYYERFKTDGVEHNLYIGASIATNLSFTVERLYELRLWQLRVLCEMEAAHHRLKPSLPYPLEVTTLILVYHTTIAIRFRMDEKRFDVDGSYNARFEIVKKRIDKALVKNKAERITQAGKITIVYSNNQEEREYLGYLHILQSEGLLKDDVEKLEVEDLQGVSGLRALRVSLEHFSE